MNKDYIAFFDLDHTILKSSSGHILGPAAIRHGIVKRRRIVEAIIYAIGHKLGLVQGDVILPLMVKWLKGHPVQPVFDFVQNIFLDVMPAAIRKEAVREIEMHRHNNAHLVLLTASMNFICKPVIEFLGLDDLICTTLHIENDHFSGTTKGDLCFGEEKLNRTLSYLNNNKNQLKNAYFYTDSFTDLPMLEAVGHPVVVSPDRRLAAMARARGWTIYRW
ncbi:HAD-IB family hydrolase [candidate division KSB1 bacterium]|nr:HAD-IB family hydrolase [candidate division KSB1 bacterium]